MNDPQPEGHVTSYIGRRKFLATLGGAVAAWPLAAHAQQRDRMRRIGVLMHLAADDPEGQRRVAAFLQGLQEAGWAIGRNVNIDLRWAAGEADRFPRYAMELVALAPDVILASATPSARAVALTASEGLASRLDLDWTFSGHFTRAGGISPGSQGL
jgi:ABC-type uncharacterized transport system substrate-binding protein